jgi:starvation-inducible DNA-binding protein
MPSILLESSNRLWRKTHLSAAISKKKLFYLQGELIMSSEVKPRHTSKKVLESLSRQLANSAVLSFKYKKFHWYVSGPYFRELHLLFDSHYDQVIATIDEYAERSRSLGGYPVATLAEFISHAEIKDATKSSYTPQEMVEALLTDTNAVIDSLHADIDDASKAGDAGTADVYTRLVQTYQKQAWFLAETAEGQKLV